MSCMHKASIVLAREQHLIIHTHTLLTYLTCGRGSGFYCNYYTESMTFPAFSHHMDDEC